MKRYETVYSVLTVIVLIIVLAFSFMCCIGCRSRQIKRTDYYKSGEIAAISYTDEHGFHLFSDGEGKTLSPNLNLNGITF